MVRDAGEDIGEPCLRIDVVELCGLDQRVDDGGALPTTIRAAEQPGLAAERDAAQRALNNGADQPGMTLPQAPWLLDRSRQSPQPAPR